MADGEEYIPRVAAWKDENSDEDLEAVLADKEVNRSQLEEWDRAERNLQEEGVWGYECHKCAAARDLAEQIDAEYGGGDPALSTLGAPVTLEDGETIDDVLKREYGECILGESGRWAYGMSGNCSSGLMYRNIRANDAVSIEQGAEKGLYRSKFYCETHETVFIEGVYEGEGRIEGEGKNKSLCIDAFEF